MDQIKLFIKFSYGTIVAFFISFIITFISTRFFSPEYYGMLSTFTIIVSTTMVLLTLGTDNAFVRFFNHYKSESRPSLLKYLLKLPSFFFILLCLFSLIFYEKISVFIIGESDLVIVVVLLITIFFELVLRFASLVLRMQKKANLYSIIQISHKLIYALAIIIMYNFVSEKYKILIFSFSSGIFITSILAVLFDAKFWFLTKKETNQINKKVLILYSLPFVISSTLSVVNENIDKFFIKLLMNDSYLGIYTAGFKLVMMISLFQGLISTMLVPIFYEHYEKNPEDFSFYTKTFNLVSILMLIISTGFIMFKDIFILILGQEYRNVSSIIPFLVFGPMMYTISETTVIGINFKKKSSYHVLVSLSVMITGIIMNYILVPILGLMGAGIAYSISSTVFFVSRSLFSSLALRIEYQYKKLSFVVIPFSLYALFASLNKIITLNFVLGFLMLILIILVYNKDIRTLYKVLSKKRIKEKEIYDYFI